VLKEITTYLKNQLGTSWVIGTNVFAGYIPSDKTADCVALIETGGKPNFYLPDAPELTFQILSRAKDYQTARNNAYLVYEKLHAKVGITLPVVVEGKEYYVNTMEAVSLPQSLGQDERGNFILSTNYILRLQDN
jgi:hypothetical protein